MINIQMEIYFNIRCFFFLLRILQVVYTVQHKNKINGNMGKPHTEGKNCDKR